MTLRISRGIKENGIIVGNVYDKYGSRNPIVKMMMKGFSSALEALVSKARPLTLHEVGCGEGYWVLRWNRLGIEARGTDFSPTVIAMARQNAVSQGLSPSLFEPRSIYQLERVRDGADLVVCCEVLEHLECPDIGLRELNKITERYLIVSVPREPLWRVLNLARGRYIRQWGNTPGHIQHFSKSTLCLMVSEYFDIEEVRSPLPWIMLLCKARCPSSITDESKTTNTLTRSAAPKLMGDQE